MEKPYKVIIIDDEPPARDVIGVFVAKIPFLHCIATCANAMQAIDAIERLKPDLIFLDIQMPEMSGMDLLGINLRNRPEVILTTAYPDFALKSYDFDVVDYLMKPIAFDRFYRAVLKFRDNRRKIDDASLIADPLPPEDSNLQPVVAIAPVAEPVSGSTEDGFVWLREEKRLLQVPFNEILYVEGLKDYVKVFLTSKMIVTHMTIGKAEEIFTEPIFLRVHRSHIVRRSAIRVIDGNCIILTNGKELTIGPSYREDLKKYIAELR